MKLGVAAFGVFLLAIIIAGPFILIWALNTLFPVLDIGYTIETWLASLIISGFFTAKVQSK